MAQIAVNAAVSLGHRLLSLAAHMASEEILLLRGVRDEIQFIIGELQVMSPFIRDAEAREMHDEAARAWVNQVKELAYVSEDCMQDFYPRLIHRQTNSNNNCLFSTWKYLMHTIRTLGTRHLIASKLQTLKSQFKIVGNRRQRYGLAAADRVSTENEFNPGKYITFCGPQLSDSESQMLLKDVQKEMVEEWLLNKAECQRSLIAVVVPREEEGRATTVVRKVYESPNIAGRFTCRALIEDPEEMEDIENVLRMLIKQVFPSPPDDYETMGQEELVGELGNHLKENKYLIVFDNLWDFDLLWSLESVLPKNDLGSRILIASFHEQRVNDLAKEYKVPVHIYDERKLSEEQSMKFFRRLMFDDAHHLCPHSLEKVSTDIVLRCSGHPQAIVSIARVLARRPSRSKPEWEETLKSFGPELDYNLGLGSGIQNLSFNYSDLPYPVKICFLYLQKFIVWEPADTPRVKLSRKFLERLWIAEGFVTNFRQTNAEDVAMYYFEELVDRSFVIPDPLRADIFYLHHDMRELFLFLEDNHRNLMQDVLMQDVFRITVIGKGIPQIMDLSIIRSLTMFGKKTPASFISPSMRMLRVLDLNGCGSLDNTHLKIIMKFFHLRYLLLRNTKVTKLPKSLRNLKRLEVLDVRSDHEVDIPETVAKLENLRFLQGKLLVSRFKTWQYLEELADVNVQRSSNGFLKVLQHLTKLQKLGCHNFNPSGSEKDWVKALQQMKYTYSLTLKSVTNLDFLHDAAPNDVSDAYPFPFLVPQILRLHGKLTTLPRWISKSPSLLKLKFAGSCLGNDAIEAIMELIRLKPLDNAYSGESLKFLPGGFSSLKELYLKSLPLKSLSFQEGAMPSLEIFHIEDCKESMKSCIGDEVIKAIGRMSSLIQLKLVGDAYNGESLCFMAEGFRSLKVLYLKSLPLKSLSFQGGQGGAMLNLEELHIEDCKEPTSGRISVSGIQSLGRLEKLYIKWMHPEDKDAVLAQARENSNCPVVAYDANI